MRKKHLGKKIRIMLVLVGIILAVQCAFVSVAVAVVYVDSTATGVGNGSSWADAYTDLQVGINSAAVSSEVWVASGTYLPTLAPYISGGADRYLHFALRNGVAVYGGFAGTETSVAERDLAVNLTYLSGDIGVPEDISDNCYHVFFHDNDTGDALNNTAILDGFIITGGNANGSEEIHKNGGGMYNHETSPTIRYCTFTANASSSGVYITGGGGGMHNFYSSPVISYSSFVNNTTTRNGGGILNWGSAPQILSSTFSNNTAPNGNGGGIHNYSSNAVITSTTVNDNSAKQDGGGIANISSSPIISNCTFANNAITNGSSSMEMYNGWAGSGMPASNPSITNCTFRGTNSLSSTAMLNYASSPVVKNSIFWTGAYNEIKNVVSGTATVTYSVLTDITSFPGNGNSDVDPLLDANGLQDNGGPVKTVAIGFAGSADNTGTTTGAPATDARGVTRENPPDIGAYELITYTIGGSVSGLAATNNMVIQNNGADDTNITLDGDYTFTVPVEDGRTYDVTVSTQPVGTTKQSCSTSNGSGTVIGANVTDADITCVNLYTIGGTISGLASGNTVELQNNGGDNLIVSAGANDFTFATAHVDGTDYDVTVLTDPTTPNQICSITTGSGTIAGGDVGSVSINCVTTTYTIGGTISGLETGNEVILQNKGGDDLTLNSNDPFTFVTAIDDGSTYLVTVLTDPTTPNQTCTVTNGSGTVSGANVTDISVACTTNMYSIGGEITGLASGNTVRLANAGSIWQFTGNGPYTMSDVTDGVTYSVTVVTQPTTPNQTCSVLNASGTILGMPVTNIDVNCVTTTYTVGGSLTGLAAGNEVILQNNTGGNLTLNSNDSFTFATALDDGSSYSVTVLTDPTTPNQTCTVTSGGGTLAGGNVTDVSVACVTTTYTVGGSIAGLFAGNEVVLQNNDGDDLVVDADGTFTFATVIDDGSTYLVSVLTAPMTPNQTCTVTSGSGTLAGDNVSTVSVNCVTNTYTIGGVVTGLFTDNSVTLQNNTGDDLTVDANGNFTFATALDDGSTYTVTVLTQPETIIQTCTVINGDSTLSGIDVNSIHVECGNTFPWNMFLPAILTIKP